MKLHLFQSGWIRTWRHLLVRSAPEGIPMRVPIPFYLIEHEKGVVLFDAGQQPPVHSLPETAPFIPELTDDDRAVNQLRQREFRPEHRA